ncbi:hypothetical protein OSB04_014578 [Centaurea solstitialis]|uniref:Small auxin up regulated protein n=1 Tax=Centaurea solstitialis TaxID=347529 RepID=A0AA38T546_9ASTR|nr:hypothetical protein OSB04_014578 [Centaurea solstitialis]
MFFDRVFFVGRQIAITLQTKHSDVPKGYLAVYVGEKQKTRFVVPVSFLAHPLFQDLLRQSEEEYGYDHSMGGLTIHCREDVFVDLTSKLPIS